jgi:hypothetical protein
MNVNFVLAAYNSTRDAKVEMTVKISGGSHRATINTLPTNCGDTIISGAL